MQRSRLASLSASLRSGPGGNRRAFSKASAARISWSILSDTRCDFLLMIQLAWDDQVRGNPSKTRPLYRTPAETALFPTSDVFYDANHTSPPDYRWARNVEEPNALTLILPAPDNGHVADWAATKKNGLARRINANCNLS